MVRKHIPGGELSDRTNEEAYSRGLHLKRKLLRYANFNWKRECEYILRIF